MTCSLTPPPSDPIFTILVALITLILVVPIVSLINYVLENYARKSPMGRGFEDDFTYEVATSQQTKDDLNSTDQFGISARSTGIIGGAKATPFEIAQSSYNECCSPLEETMDILQRVYAFLAVTDFENISLPWMISLSDQRYSERDAKTKAIEECLGVFPDGNFVPLTMRQKLQFWTPLARLENRLARVRATTKSITKQINSFKTWEVDIKDNRLIKQFIFGCLTPFKRYALQAIVAPYEELHEECVSWPVYILSWLLITCVLMFFVYWIFAWGVYSGGDAVRAWGMTFGVALAESALLVQVTEFYVVFYLPALAMQPQLQHIRAVLADVSMSFVNRHDESRGGSEGESDSAEKTGTNTREHFSVVQLVSPACRASWSPELKALPAAWLLRQIDDKDVLRCREGRTSYLGTISFFAMMIPLSCIVLNEYIGEKLVNLVIGGMYSALLVAGADLYSMSLPTLLFPFCIIAGLIIYYHCIFLPARLAIIQRQEKLRKLRVQRETVTVSSHWRMKRQAADGTALPSNRPCGYLRRVTKMIKHAAQSGISACSDKGLRDKRISEVISQRAWCDMNRAPGGVSDTSSHVQSPPALPPIFVQTNPLYNGYMRSSSRQMSRQPSSFLPPMPIQNMMTSINAHRALKTAETAITHRTATVLRRQSALFGIIDEESETAKDDQFVITRTDRFIASTRRPAAPILFEASDAILRMKTRLAKSAPRESEDALHVTVADLDREFRAILDIFYPDGIMLSKVERDEAYESLTYWLDNKSPPEMLRWTESTAPVVPVVSFESFERWFIEDLLGTLHNIMTDRLLSSSTFAYKVKIRSAMSFARSASIGGGSVRGGGGGSDGVGRSNSGITLRPTKDRRMSYECDSDKSIALAPWIMARENSK